MRILPPSWRIIRSIAALSAGFSLFLRDGLPWNERAKTIPSKMPRFTVDSRRRFWLAVDCLAGFRMGGFDSSWLGTDNDDLANSSVDTELCRIALLVLSREREYVVIRGKEDEGPGRDDGGLCCACTFDAIGDELHLILPSDSQSVSVLAVIILEGRLGVLDKVERLDVPVPLSDNWGELCSANVGVAVFPSFVVDWRIAPCGEDARTTEGEEAKAGRFLLDFRRRLVGTDEAGSGRLEGLDSLGSSCCAEFVRPERVGKDMASNSDLTLELSLIMSPSNLGGCREVPGGLVSGIVSLYSTLDVGARGSGRSVVQRASAGASMSFPLDPSDALVLFSRRCGGIKAS